MDEQTTNATDETIDRFLGMPMRWEPRKTFANLWNPEDDRVFPPKYFGIGWDLNFWALAKRLRRTEQQEEEQQEQENQEEQQPEHGAE